MLNYFAKPCPIVSIEAASSPLNSNTSRPDEESTRASTADQDDPIPLDSATGDSEAKLVSVNNASESDSHAKTEPPRSKDLNNPYKISRVSAGHIPALKQLTSSILPIAYSPRFYVEATEDSSVSDFTYTATHLDRPVGWITCRVLQPSPSTQLHQPNELYIRALCILAPHREEGLASRLLQTILEPSLLSKHKIRIVFAHVWECNADALEWYAKRGFQQLRLERNYYKRLNPKGAWIVQRKLSVTDYLPLKPP